MRVIAIGEELPSGYLYLKRGSKNVIELWFWDDEEGLVPSNLTGTTPAIDVYEDDGTNIVTWSTGTGHAVISGNKVTWTLTAAEMVYTWTHKLFKLRITDEVYLAGQAVMQG